MPAPPEVCPNCGSTHTDRIEVDIGVGVQYGPLECFECGYFEDQDVYRWLEQHNAT